MLFRRVFLSIAFLFAFATSATLTHAQAVAATSKIVIIDTTVFFNEKAGITRIVAASKTLSADLASRRSEVQTMVTRIESLNKELDSFRANAGKGIPVDERNFQTKVDEVERLKREAKYKGDDFNAHAQKRQTEIVGPVYAEVVRSLAEYVKTKDYGLLFDVSKDQNGILLYASEKHDITKEFVTYYNTRPVTAIAPVPR